MEESQQVIWKVVKAQFLTRKFGSRFRDSRAGIVAWHFKPLLAKPASHICAPFEVPATVFHPALC